MNKKELKNNLNPGEKVADILEYHYGQNGNKLVYQVTVYTCRKFLFFKYISTYKFPFYFASKKLAEEYLQYIDKFEIDFETEQDMWGDSCGIYYILIPKNIKKPHYMHKMNNVDIISLHKGEVWNGYVNCMDIKAKGRTVCKNVYFTEIENMETNASKEGTIGNRFSYKLQPVN